MLYKSTATAESRPWRRSYTVMKCSAVPFRPVASPELRRHDLRKHLQGGWRIFGDSAICAAQLLLYLHCFCIGHGIWWLLNWISGTKAIFQENKVMQIKMGI